MPRKLTSESFIAKSKLKHGDSYRYDSVLYKDRGTKVIITCPTHGDFEQMPYRHLQGRGCPDCGKMIHNSSTDKFISTAKEVHGDKYDYSKVVYSNNRIKVLITCHEHGDFKQEPRSHLSGHLCPSCSKSGYQTSKNAFLYIHTVKVDDEIIGYKIGITNNTVESRLKNIQRKSLATIENVLSFEGSGITIKNLETLIHSECRLVSDLREVLPDGHTEVIHKDDLGLALTLIKETLK